MFNKLKQFKDLRSQAKQVQNALSQEKAEGSGSSGKVKVVMDGNQELISVTIDPSILTAEYKATVENGVKEAVKDATGKVKQIMMKKMRSGEIEMPDLSSLQ